MKTNIAISSWGNIGKALAAIHLREEESGGRDMELVGIIRRNANDKGGEEYPAGVRVVSDVLSLPVKPDVIICAAPSHCVMEDVQKYLAFGIATVDCFDNHKEIPAWRMRLDTLAKINRAVAVTGSGWDPGFDSAIRALSGLVVTENESVTTFGPGRSMGHTTTVKALSPAIKDAVALTLPGEKPGLQRREVYIVLDAESAGSAAQNGIRDAVLLHPYFKNDDTHVFFVDSIAGHDTERHGGVVTRSGSAASLEVKLSGGNALMTAAAMYGSARAANRALEAGNYGCKTLAEIAPLDFIKGDTVDERLARIKY